MYWAPSEGKSQRTIAGPAAQGPPGPGRGAAVVVVVSPRRERPDPGLWVVRVGQLFWVSKVRPRLAVPPWVVSGALPATV
jgi:hypothetical protein